jgi:ligand-binding sensor domain-containing protein
MKRYFQYILLIHLALSTVSAIAQTPYFNKHALPLAFKDAVINCALQDRNQFIWLGTSAGLVRFNGVNYKHYLQFADKKNEISALFEDSTGVLWIGYQDGSIGKMTGEKFAGDPILPGPFNVPVTGFAEAGQALWIATYGQGVVKIDSGGIKSFTTANGLKDDFVYDIVADGAGRVFAGTDQGLVKFTSRGNDTTIKIYSEENGLLDNIVTSLSLAKDGTLWIGNESMGIASFDQKSERASYLVDQWPYGRVSVILVFDKEVWAGTAGSGIIEVNQKNSIVNQLNRIDRTLPGKITDMIHDREGNVWVANATKTVYTCQRLFTFLTGFMDNETGSLQSILYTRDGNLMFSTSTGIFKYNFSEPDDHRLSRISIPQLQGTQVISLYQDESGGIWFGTFDRGVYHQAANSTTVRRYTERDGLVNNNVLSIAGSGKELWFATLGGVSRGAAEQGSMRFQNFTSESGLGSNYIYKTFIDSKNRVWFATDGKGISMLENNVFKNFSLTEGLNSAIVYSVAEDSNGVIWLSTSSAGIYRFNGASFEAFTPHTDLRDLNITSIVGDMSGNLLIVSPQGIDVLNTKAGSVLYHGEESGISGIDPNLNAYTVDDEGNIWFATQNGIIKYNVRLPRTANWPITKINEMQIFLTKADTSVKKIAYNQNHISFDYMGFWYRDPDEVSYKIKLEGYDREWIDSKNHFITYPNLPPGDYTFKVRSSATDFFEGAKIQTLSFVIAPPFYRSLWFYALCSIGLLAIVLGVVANRERRIKSLQRAEREKIQFQFETLKNQVNPHFLFNSFNTLVGIIEDDKDSAVEYVHKLSDFYRDVLVNREKQMLPLREELELIRNYFFLQAKRYRDNFRLSIHIPDDKMDWGIPPMTLQLLVENALKHNIVSRDKPLSVEISMQSEMLVVRNNLQKKIVQEASTGIGLSNVSSRIRLLTNKEVRVEASATHFTVYIPLSDPNA